MCSNSFATDSRGNTQKHNCFDQLFRRPIVSTNCFDQVFRRPIVSTKCFNQWFRRPTNYFDQLFRPSVSTKCFDRLFRPIVSRPIVSTDCFDQLFCLPIRPAAKLPGVQQSRIPGPGRPLWPPGQDYPGNDTHHRVPPTAQVGQCRA